LGNLRKVNLSPRPQPLKNWARTLKGMEIRVKKGITQVNPGILPTNKREIILKNLGLKE